MLSEFAQQFLPQVSGKCHHWLTCLLLELDEVVEEPLLLGHDSGEKENHTSPADENECKHPSFAEFSLRQHDDGDADYHDKADKEHHQTVAEGCVAAELPEFLQVFSAE